MFYGRRQLGQWLDIAIQCADANRTPSLPVDCPMLRIKRASDGATIYSREMPICEKQGTAIGLFLGQVFLGSDFHTGEHAVQIAYTVGSHTTIETGTFQITGGGNPNGQVIGMAWFDRPNRSNILYQVESGRIIRGSNPRIK